MLCASIGILFGNQNQLDIELYEYCTQISECCGRAMMFMSSLSLGVHYGNVITET